MKTARRQSVSISKVAILLLFALFGVANAEDGANSQAIVQHQEACKSKIEFIKLSDIKNKQKIYAQIWKKVLSKEFKSESDLESGGISENTILVSLVDLNDDGRGDIIIIPSKEYCGAEGCSPSVILSGSTHVSAMEFCTSVQISVPICVSDASTDGLRNIIANNGRTIRFNKSSYCYK